MSFANLPGWGKLSASFFRGKRSGLKMRLIAWNIRAGGGSRVAHIAQALSAWQGDVLVLSEFRSTAASQALADSLFKLGYLFQVQTCDQVAHGRNALLIAARTPLRKVHLRRYPTEPGRWCAVRLDNGVFVGGVHVPNQHTGRKPQFHDSLLDLMQRWRGPAIIAGDTNSGRQGEDEETPVFNRRTTQWFDHIHAAGWHDCFRLVHGEKREFTWYSPGYDNGFRLDQAFVSASLKADVQHCAHLWAEHPDQPNRRDGVSDHAALVLDVAV